MTRKWIIDYPMRTYIIDEMSKFKNPGDTRSFLDTLDRKKRKRLMKWLSSWRKNMIYEKIMKTFNWELKRVPINRIFIGAINEDVKPIIRFHDYNVGQLVKADKSTKNLLAQLGFGDQGKIKTDVFIARRDWGDYKIIDGAHRAVRLAWAGAKELNLLVIAPITTTFWERMKIRWYNMFHDGKLCPGCGSTTIDLRPFEMKDKCLSCELDW